MFSKNTIRPLGITSIYENSKGSRRIGNKENEFRISEINTVRKRQKVMIEL
jgi:hypothetical protein